MSAKRPSRRGKQPGSGARRPRQAPERDLGPRDSTVTARKLEQEEAWELVHPRCARERREDLEEVQTMLDAGEVEIARDECRWLLQGCSDCLDAHRLLGEMALEENDLPLARGHFGYAFRLGTLALDRAGTRGPLPYGLTANQSFHESGKALAWCLVQLGKRDLATEVVDRLLACDPDDPLGARGLLDGQAHTPGG